jgi:hypothetical protein
MSQRKPQKKRSTVRHTRAIQRDRSKRPLVAPPDAQIEGRLRELLLPAIAAERPQFKALGLRERHLPLLVMVAIVISLIWRQLGSSGSEIARLLGSEGLLWVPVVVVTQQAISERLRTFPPELLWGCLQHLMPVLRARWQARHRPLPPVLAWAQERYTAVLAADGSTLDALLCKVGLLRAQATWPLAGKLFAVLDVCMHLPHAVWYTEEAQTHDQQFWEHLVHCVPAGALLLLDLGFTNFGYYARLDFCTFVTRAKSNLAYKIGHVVQQTAAVRDYVIWVGQGATRQQLRLVWVRHAGCWYRYLTNELDPQRLPALYVANLYRQRWRIEDVFHIVKRVLGLAYFWTGSVHGILLQVWATWMVYGILVDLTDAVAEALERPFQDLSLEMVYRGLYYFQQAYQRGEADDPITYLAANASRLGIIKQRCKGSKAKMLALTSSANP